MLSISALTLAMLPGLTVVAPKSICVLCRYVAFERFGNLLFWDGADDLLDDLPVLEHQERRDAADVVLARRIHRLVHVELRHLELACVIVGDLRHRLRGDGSDSRLTDTAVGAPCRMPTRP